MAVWLNVVHKNNRTAEFDVYAVLREQCPGFCRAEDTTQVRPKTDVLADLGLYHQTMEALFVIHPNICLEWQAGSRKRAPARLWTGSFRSNGYGLHGAACGTGGCRHGPGRLGAEEARKMTGVDCKPPTAHDKSTHFGKHVKNIQFSERDLPQTTAFNDPGIDTLMAAMIFMAKHVRRKVLAFFSFFCPPSL